MTLESLGNDKLHISNTYVREFLAEFLGTFILVSFGAGVNAQHVLSRGSAGSFLTVNFGWGMGCAMGVWVSGGISGGHINPAVSLAMAIIGKFKFRKVLIYWAAQYLGAFAASACVFGVYYDALNHYDGGIRSIHGDNGTAGIWGTYPSEFLQTKSGFADQTFGTMLLLLCVMAITDPRNMTPPKGMVPFAVGIVVFLIGATFGYNCGFAINPARDLSPRIFTAIAGWGSSCFSVDNYWFWVPVVGSHVGAVAGALIYLLFVGFHAEDETAYDVEQKQVTLRDLPGVQNSDFSLETKQCDSSRF